VRLLKDGGLKGQPITPDEDTPINDGGGLIAVLDDDPAGAGFARGRRDHVAQGRAQAD
jgi:hypothetical protein